MTDHHRSTDPPSATAAGSAAPPGATGPAQDAPGPGVLPPAAGQSTRDWLRRIQQSGDGAALDAALAHLPADPDPDDADGLAIRAVIQVMTDRPQAARASLAALDPARLGDAGAWADYGLALFLLGESSAADALVHATHQPDAGAEAFARLGALHLARDDLAAAEAAYRAALLRAPDRAELLSNLGGVRLRLGDCQEALDLYDQALALRPDLGMTRVMRSRALLALDRADETIEEAEAALAQAPDDPLCHLALATTQMQADRWAQADATLTTAIDRCPDSDLLKQALATLLLDQKAVMRLGQLLKAWAEGRDPPDWTSLALARARIEAGFLDAADAGLAALASTPLAQDPGYPVLLARLAIERGQVEVAIGMVRDTLERFPGHAEARVLLGHALTSVGRLDEARALADAQAMQGTPAACLAALETAPNTDDLNPDILARAERLRRAPHLEADTRARICFALAEAHDRRGDVAAAFAAAAEANTLVRRRLSYDWRRHRRLVRRQIAAVTPEVVARLSAAEPNRPKEPGETHDPRGSTRPIFVVGMPRSGTTLTEQILSSHPDVYGAGELPWVPRLATLMPRVVAGGLPYPEALRALTDRQLTSAAAYYLDRIAHQNATAPRVVDKLPHNFDHVGLIALMFPRAPIIHLVRDPRDVALSNYFQNYAAAQGLMGFAYDLADIGRMLQDHDQVMALWYRVFPGRIFTLTYENLVRTPEPVIRALLAHCGLDWDDRVLRFFETRRPVRTASIRQVRRTIYTTSSGRWRRYQDWLDPLEAVLAAPPEPPGPAPPGPAPPGPDPGPVRQSGPGAPEPLA